MVAMSFSIPTLKENIACQDLLKDRECRFSSWLRKQSFRNKLNIFKWPQVFVVICDCCIYYYRDETARRPSGSFSLYGYNKIERATDVPHTEAPWAFRIIHTFKEYKTYLFSASSEVEMKEWMKKIKKEMKLANNQNIPGSVVGDGDDVSQTYQDIESKIYDDPDDLRIPTNYKNRRNDDYTDDDDIYAIRGPVAPPVPAREGGRTRGATMHTPRVKQLTSELNLKLDLSKQEQAVTENKGRRRGNPDGASIKREHKEVYTDAASSQVDDEDDDAELDPETYWAAIHYLGDDNAKATAIIQNLAEDGVYLVRDSSTKGDKVLVVFAEDSPRKFKIEWKDEQSFLNSRKDISRPSLEELLHFYYENNLPNYKVCLTTPYKLHPKFKESMLK